MGRRVWCSGVVLLVVFVLCPAGATPAAGETRDGRIIATAGLAWEADLAVRVDILLFVPTGTDEETAGRAALDSVGATPLGSSTDQDQRQGPELRWRQFVDTNPGNDFVLQSYNRTGEPPTGDFVAAFRTAQRPWSEVPAATFALQFAGLSTRCPSLSCGQGLDGFNDVGWRSHDGGGGHFLALTSVAFRIDTGFIVEADITIDPRFEFFTDEPPAPPPPPRSCPPPPPPGEPPPPPPPGPPPPPPPGPPPPPVPQVFDVVTVMLHENGHLAGLDHSADCEAVMFPELAPLEMRRALGGDDVDELARRYPLEFAPVPFEPPPPHSPG